MNKKQHDQFEREMERHKNRIDQIFGKKYTKEEILAWTKKNLIAMNPIWEEVKKQLNS